MKVLLVAEYREGALLTNYSELLAFSEELGAESAMFLVGGESELPLYSGTLYLADVEAHGEFNPSVHKQLLLDVVAREQPDMVVFSHSSYGWDLAPRVAFSLSAAQVSEVVEVIEGVPVVPVCNSKLRRKVQVKTATTVLTLQAGAFTFDGEPEGTPLVEKISSDSAPKIVFEGYEE